MAWGAGPLCGSRCVRQRAAAEVMQLTALMGPEIATAGPIDGIEIAGITADSRAVRPGFCLRRSPAQGPTARGSSPMRWRRERQPCWRRRMRRSTSLAGRRLARERAATGAGVNGCTLSWRAAGNDRRHHRHQWQNLDRRVHAADLCRLRTASGFARHHRRRKAGRRGLWLADDARSRDAAQDAGGTGDGGRNASRSRGLLARSRPVPSRRRAATAAAFNNLGRDHLDYHPTMAAYLDAKLRLFRELLLPGQVAVVNADGPEAATAVAQPAGARPRRSSRPASRVNVAACRRPSAAGFRQGLTYWHSARRRGVSTCR